MTDILFVHGGDSFAREVFRGEGRGYWSQALPLVLEKHGFGIDEAGPDALRDPRALAAYATVLVARLPDDAWVDADPEALVAGDAPLLLEGLLPPTISAALGVEVQERISDDGGVVVTDPALRDASEAYGMAIGAALTGPVRSAVNRENTLSWPALDVPIEPPVADAWRARSWDVERWIGGPDTAVLADWVNLGDSADRSAAIVRRGSLVACSFGLFTFLGQRHTSEPFEGAESRSTARSAGLEAVLCGLIDQMHRRADAVRARVLPWPGDARWVRTFRHDVDRAPERPRELAEQYERQGVHVTWNCRAATARESLGALSENGWHELALGAEAVWAGQGEDEAAQIEQATGRPVAGVAWRRAGTNFGYQGAPNLLWADARGFEYAEMLEHAHYHPHRFAAMDSDGSLRSLRIICLPHPESVTLRRGFDLEIAADIGRRWSAARGALQFALGAPDPAVLASVGPRIVAASAQGAPLEWTAQMVANWWGKTHVGGAITITQAAPGHFEIRAREPIDDLAVELLAPDGRRHVHVVSVGAEPLTLTLDVEPSAEPVLWEDVIPHYSEAVNKDFARSGLDATSAKAAGSIRNITAGIPSRGEFLLRLCADLTGRTVEGLRVLDVGTGYGALAAYVAWRGRTRRMVGTDVSHSMLTAARSAANAAGLDSLVEFDEADMREHSQYGDADFDLVIANGVLMYLSSGSELTAALKEFRRLLAPGGHLVVYQRNREAWLPRPRAGAKGAQTGGPQRWVSPVGLGARMYRAGFRDLRLIGFTGSERLERGVSRLVAESYGLGGRRT